MATSPNSPDPAAKLDEMVKKFIVDLNSAGYPLFVVVSAYRHPNGEGRYRSMLNGDSPEIIESLHSAIKMLSQEDFDKLMDVIGKEHPEIAAFRQLARMPSSGVVH